MSEAGSLFFDGTQEYEYYIYYLNEDSLALEVNREMFSGDWTEVYGHYIRYLNGDDEEIECFSQ